MNIVQLVLLLLLGVALFFFGGLPLMIIGVGSITITALLLWLSKKFGNRQKEVVIQKKPNSDGKPFLDVRHSPNTQNGVEAVHIGMNHPKEPMFGKEIIDLTEVTQDLVTLETARANARTEEARAQTAQACKEIAHADVSPFVRDQMLRKINSETPIVNVQKRKRGRPRLTDPDDIVGLNQHFPR